MTIRESKEVSNNTDSSGYDPTQPRLSKVNWGIPTIACGVTALLTCAIILPFTTMGKKPASSNEAATATVQTVPAAEQTTPNAPSGQPDSTQGILAAPVPSESSPASGAEHAPVAAPGNAHHAPTGSPNGELQKSVP